METKAKRKMFSFFKNNIPYFKDLRQITGSVTGAILMSQLEYWFEKYPDGFYKFLEPADHELYREGQSWTEELGFSAKEFRCAFDVIGYRYKSKRQFDDAKNKFIVKKESESFVYYCCYHDKIKFLTYYFRNPVVDTEIDKIIAATYLPKGTLRSEPKVSYVDAQREDTYLPKGNLHIKGISYPTSETTSYPTSELKEDAPNGAHAHLVSDKIIFGEHGNVKITAEEKAKLDQKYGADFVLKCVEKLDIYKGSRGKKYKSDYLAILNWVVDAVKNGNGNGNGKTGQKQDFAHYDEQNRKYWEKYNARAANAKLAKT